MLYRYIIIDIYHLWVIMDSKITWRRSMAEFCLRCFNELNGTNYQSNEVWLEEDFCEGCEDRQLCVVGLRHKPLLWRLVGMLSGLFQK